ncbi:MAG: substrate-binding domain-containing protein [Phycisphaeraceae bacterium]|nr:substrate-binding domain-containing protein [Phycisphaeraceae bacterium]
MQGLRVRKHRRIKLLPRGEAKLVVGFSQVGAESAWRTAETASIKKEAEKRSVELKISDAQGKQANQTKAVWSFITRKVSVIVVAPVVETGWELVLREAQRAGIPVILVDRGIINWFIRPICG